MTRWATHATSHEFLHARCMYPNIGQYIMDSRNWKPHFKKHYVKQRIQSFEKKIPFFRNPLILERPLTECVAKPAINYNLEVGPSERITMCAKQTICNKHKRLEKTCTHTIEKKGRKRKGKKKLTPKVTRPGPLALGRNPSTLSFSVGSDLYKRSLIRMWLTIE